ncbi:efflux RND transporter permease subunit [Microbulbifer thermotolerans]|uniref:efflux RND transporter permease subunit n=1 Tax=Microbulbifer thermotolerans TaxID=252514 RepID=UPI002249497E|nr:efflux RND transporter permease subunit [Microbulbifer thermotolerans]MCX2833058.1 efflux RND transporter permease subunit [Microbulbifer thermotolerans]
MSDLDWNKGIIPWFARNPVAANLLLALVIALGLFQMGSLRKEAFPSMEPDSITISVTYDSGSATQSEEGLGLKIEEALEEVTGIKHITTAATTSGVTVIVEKQSDYDLDVLLRDVKTKVDAISNFPANAENPVIEKAEREEHSLWLQLHGDTDRHTLQQLAERLKSDLLDHPDINRVSESGWRDPMIAIEVDEGQLQAYGLSLSDVEDAINEGSPDTMTALLKNQNVYLQLKASQQAYLKEDFAAIPLLTTSDGVHLTLGDVAKIKDTYDDDSPVLSRFNGENSVALQVVTTGLDDITKTVKAAREVVEQWHAEGRLPQGVELSSWYDRSEAITERLQLLVSNALTGILLVFVLLALFLNLTVAFWVAMGLPFIFFGTLYFMGDSFAGLSLNEFTTFGFILALGIVVDDAVVVGESVYTVRSQEGDTLRNTIKGTLRVAVPTLFGVFTTVVAFYSLSNISGHLGQLYAQFAAIVTICLLLSVVESKLILPAHLAHLNTRKTVSGNPLLRQWQRIQHGADAGLQWFNERLYKPTIEWALTFRYAVAVAFIGLLILVMAMPLTGAVRLSFFPDIPGDTVRASIAMQTDASYGQTHSALLQLEAKALEIDRRLVRQAGAEGSGIADIQVLAEADQSGQVTIELADQSPYDIQTFTRQWKQEAGIPEGVRTLSIANRREMVDALRIELRANDDELLTAAGADLKAELEQIPAVSGIEDNLQASQPQLFLKLNAQGKSMGLTTDSLAVQVLQAFKGQVVQRFQRNSDEIEVRVRYPEEARQNPVDVLRARIRTDDGTVLPLSSVATIEYGYARDTITRIDGKRALYLSADVDKEAISATELVASLSSNLVPKLERQYPGLDIQFTGEAEQQAETQTSMVSVFITALLVIYILLAVPLKSYIQPILIMTAIPFGVVGAILGHWVNGLPMSILSFNGIIALSGVVVNDSLLLVSRYNDLKPDADHQLEAISEACRSRLRAVLLTSFTTFAGLVPLLSETSTQAQFLIPAAVALGYGIMFATVITLILIPVLVAIQHDVSEVLGKLKRAFTMQLKAGDANPC